MFTKSVISSTMVKSTCIPAKVVRTTVEPMMTIVRTPEIAKRRELPPTRAATMPATMKGAIPGSRVPSGRAPSADARGADMAPPSAQTIATLPQVTLPASGTARIATAAPVIIQATAIKKPIHGVRRVAASTIRSQVTSPNPAITATKANAFRVPRRAWARCIP